MGKVKHLTVHHTHAVATKSLLYLGSVEYKVGSMTPRWSVLSSNGLQGLTSVTQVMMPFEVASEHSLVIPH